MGNFTDAQLNELIAGRELSRRCTGEPAGTAGGAAAVCWS